MAAKRRKYQKRKKSTSKMDMAVIILIVVSILLAVLIYTKSGMIGTKLNEILGGVFGIVQYILPIGIFVIAIKIASSGNEEFKMKLIQYGILIIALSVVLSVFQISAGELQTSGELSTIVKDAYYLGSQNNGGGAIGAVGAVPLVNLLGVVGAIILCIGIAAILVVFTFGINLTEMIQNMADKMEEKREEKLEYREQRKKELAQMSEEERETPAQRRRRERQERLAKKELENRQNNPMENQIKINFGGRIVDGAEEKPGLKKYDHSNDDLEPLTKETKKGLLAKKQEKEAIQPDVLENNLFKQEDEQKEEKKREVLQLEHAMTVEDEHYEYPPVELLSKPGKKTLKGGAKALTDTATKLQKT